MGIRNRMFLSWLERPAHRPRVRRSMVLATMLLTPMGVGVRIPSDADQPMPIDSVEGDNGERVTSLRFGAGSGTYGRDIHARREIFLGYDNCTGLPTGRTYDTNFRFKSEYRDYGGEVDAQVTEHGHMGIRGGWVDETVTYLGSTLDEAVVDSVFGTTRFKDSSSYYYVNPFWALEKPDIGFGVGVIASDSRLWTKGEKEFGEHDDPTIYPTAHLRLGRLDKVYFKASMFESVPVYSGGGVTVVGIGVRPIPPIELWGGMGFDGPYSEDNFILRASADLGRHATLGVNVRVPSAADETFQPTFDESGVGFELGWKFYRNSEE
jgi:hypothetical protein